MELPAEIWHNILSYLELSAALTVACTNKRLYDIVASRSFAVDRLPDLPLYIDTNTLLYKVLQNCTTIYFHRDLPLRPMIHVVYAAKNARIVVGPLVDINRWLTIFTTYIKCHPSTRSLDIYLNRFNKSMVKVDKIRSIKLYMPNANVYKCFCKCKYHQPYLYDDNSLCHGCKHSHDVVAYSQHHDLTCKNCSQRCSCAQGYALDFCNVCDNSICPSCCCGDSICRGCHQAMGDLQRLSLF
jgi:hypothetical protein